MGAAKYNKEIGRIRRIIFKTEEKAFGFIEGNSNTNGKDYYFKLVKDDDYYLDRGDLVSFKPREYDDGNYSAFNVMILDKDTAFWKTLYSENGQNLYEKIKPNLGVKDLNKIWKRIPVDEILNHKWLLKDIEGPEAVPLVNTLITRDPDNYKELILELIAQNKEAFQALVTRKKYPKIIDYIEKSVPDDYLLEHEWVLKNLIGDNSPSFLDRLISKDPDKHKELILKLIEQNRILFRSVITKREFQNTIDYIQNNKDALEKLGTSLPEFITTNGLADSGATDLESIPRHLITENVLGCFPYKKRIEFLICHDDLREQYKDYFKRLIKYSYHFEDDLLSTLPEKVITEEILKLFDTESQLSYFFSHEEIFKNYYDYFKSIAPCYKGNLCKFPFMSLMTLKCFSFSKQKEYLLKKYSDTNGLIEDPVLLDYLRYLLVHSTEIFKLDEIPEDLLTDDIFHKLPLYERLSFYGDRIIKYFDNTALKNRYLKEWEKAALEEIDKIEAGTVNPLFVTESVFNAFNKNQKTEYVMKTLLKVEELDKRIDPEILLDRLPQCGDFKLEEIGNLPRRFLDDRRLLDALKCSNNTPREKVLFIYQLVKTSKLSKELIDCLQPEEGTIYAPVHYLAHYSCSNDSSDLELMNKSFIELKKTTSNLLKENDYDTVAEELSVILPTCHNRTSLDYGTKYRYFCDAVFEKDRKTDSKQNASNSWCRGYRKYRNHGNWVGNGVCPGNIPYRSDYTEWTIVELFDAFKAVRKLKVPKLQYPEDYIPKICGTFNWLFKNRQLIECSFCHELMEEDMAYSKERTDKDDTDVFAAYINTVYGCKKAQDENSKHDYKVYLNHCHVCREDSTIDSRVSHFQDIKNNRKFYLCMECGSGGYERHYVLNGNKGYYEYEYVTTPGTVCPNCGSDNMEYIGRIILKGVYQHVFQCNDCLHKIGLRNWDFERFYPAGTLYAGENLRGKGFIQEGYELYKDNVLFKVYDSRLKMLVDVTSE